METLDDETQANTSTPAMAAGATIRTKGGWPPSSSSLTVVIKTAANAEPAI